MKVDVVLWFFAGILAFGVANLVAATIVFRRRERKLASTSASSSERGRSGPILGVLALALIMLALMAALILDVELVLPVAPEIRRSVLYVVGALIAESFRRMLSLLRNVPSLLPGSLRAFDILLLLLAIVGVLLRVLILPR